MRAPMAMPCIFIEADDPEAALAQAIRDTEDAIDTYLDWQQQMRGVTASTLHAIDRDLHEVYAIELPDPWFGRVRQLTVADTCNPGWGAHLLRAVRAELEDLGIRESVISRLFGRMRAFHRYLPEYPVLLTGIDLVERYGRLGIPLGARDVPRKRRIGDCPVPRPEDLPLVYEAVIDWKKSRRRYPHPARRSAAMFITAADSGARGADLRRALLAWQTFDRRADGITLNGQLVVAETKNGDDHTATLSEFGSAYLDYYLSRERPHFPYVEQMLPVFPQTQDPSKVDPMTASSLTQAMAPLLAYLKERGLIDQRFSFHWTRKMFATNYLEQPGATLSGLMRRGGWRSLSAVASYVQAREDRVERGKPDFRRNLGRRRPR